MFENSSKYFDTTGGFWLYSKNEATHINANVADGNIFKFFSYKGKLFGNTETDEANQILKNAKTAVPLKYFKSFGSHLKSYLLIAKSNWNLSGPIIVL